MGHNGRDGSDGQDFREHPFVEALIRDPAEPPDVTVLRGYPGKGATAGSWYVWSSLEFDEYVKVDEADILHMEHLSDDRPSILWMRKSALVQRVRPEPRQMQAEFLTGPVTTGRLMGGTLGAVPRPAGARAESLLTCPSEGFNCESKLFCLLQGFTGLTIWCCND